MLENHGLYWNTTDLRLLKRYMTQNLDIIDAARRLQRTPSACSVMWREICRMDMMLHGDADDTLASWKKKQKEGPEKDMEAGQSKITYITNVG